MVIAVDPGLLIAELVALVALAALAFPDGFGGAAGSEGTLALLAAGPEGAALGGGAGAF